MAGARPWPRVPAPPASRSKGASGWKRTARPYLSWGRVVLLERIRDLGSIAAAARSMDMAYSHAWTLVAEMNRLAGQELVARTFGGATAAGPGSPPRGRRPWPSSGAWWTPSGSG